MFTVLSFSLGQSCGGISKRLQKLGTPILMRFAFKHISTYCYWIDLDVNMFPQDSSKNKNYTYICHIYKVIRKENFYDYNEIWWFVYR